ncbi:MAG: SAM-dependent methyltransferase, partial [Pirellulaceae bacterium]
MITAKRPVSTNEVASHYDELDRFYRRLWGDHVHHGLWRSGGETPAEAVEQLMETVIQPLQLTSRSHVCDVGCGYGGTSRYIVDKLGAQVTGITLSPAQQSYAKKINQDKANPLVIVGDWTANSFPAESFDSVVSIECLAHIIDKQAFFQEINRVLRPGG